MHLEEDVAKLQHFPANGGEAYSLVDVNRSGVPLMEVVSAPDLRSAEEARTYLMTLHSILQYLGVSTGNMQDGSFRCDANISIRPRGSAEFGTRTEIKNMNSFHSVHQALEFEARRQRRVLEDGGQVVQETRGWVQEQEVTVSQRSKEYAHDYRYFPDPDLPPLAIDDDWIEEIRSRLPELASQRRERFISQYGLSEYDARLLTGSKVMADYFEDAAAQAASDGQSSDKLAKSLANWILGDLSRLMNLESLDVTQLKVTSAHLAELVGLLDAGSISAATAKTVLEEAFYSGGAPGQIVEKKGYTQISDSSEIEGIVAQALAANPKAVADYLGGKDEALRYIVGQVMKITRGQANPEVVNSLLLAQLEERRKLNRA